MRHLNIRLAVGDRVQVLERGVWLRGGIVKAKNSGSCTIEIGMCTKHLPSTSAHIWRHKRSKVRAKVRATRRRKVARPRKDDDATVVAPPSPMTVAKPPRTCGLWGCTLSRFHTGMCQPAAPPTDRRGRAARLAVASPVRVRVAAPKPSRTPVTTAAPAAPACAPIEAEHVDEAPPLEAAPWSLPAAFELVATSAEGASGSSAGQAPAEPRDVPAEPPAPPSLPCEDDPCAALRAAAAAKGLVLSELSGRRLGENELLASEVVELAHANVGSYSGWDAKQRLADLTHPQTKILMLRLRPDACNSEAACGETPPPQSPLPRARASRSQAAATAASDTRPQGQGTRVGSARVGSAVVGFASFRLVIQETLRVVYLFELHLAEPLRRQSLGTHFLGAVRAHGMRAKRQGLLLTCHLANEGARGFYAARGLCVSPISPSRCAPSEVAAEIEYDVLQSLWDTDAVQVMEARGALARSVLHTSTKHGGATVGAGAADDAAADGAAAAAVATSLSTSVVAAPPSAAPSATAVAHARSPPAVSDAASASSTGTITGTCAARASGAPVVASSSPPHLLYPAAPSPLRVGGAICGKLSLADLCVPPRRAAVAASARFTPTPAARKRGRP